MGLFDFFKSSGVSAKERSLQRMATNMGCQPTQVRAVYLQSLQDEVVNRKQVRALLDLLNVKKYEEAKKFGINPDDSGSAMLQTWATEFFASKNYNAPANSIDDEVVDMMVTNKGFAEIMMEGDENQLLGFLDKNDDVTDKMFNALINANNPGEKYIDQSYSQLHEKKDPVGAIEIINQGLKINDNESESQLYYLRALCQDKLFNFEEALQDVNRSISSELNSSNPNYAYLASRFEQRAELKSKTGNEKGAVQDKLVADEYYEKHEQNKGPYDDLPF